MKPVKRYRVSGRVQGVGFRYFVYQQAADLGVDGWVRNMTDGTVEALIAGSEETHREMQARIEDGPRFARVTTVAVVEEPEDPVGPGFEIRRDGV